MREWPSKEDVVLYGLKAPKRTRLETFGGYFIVIVCTLFVFGGFGMMLYHDLTTPHKVQDTWQYKQGYKDGYYDGYWKAQKAHGVY